MHRRLLFVLAIAACGDPETPYVPDEIDMVLDAHWVDVNARGVTVAVRQDGATRTYARGVANVADAIDLVPTDRMRVGSITKTFTAATILQLSDEGALSLADPIDTWVPGFSLGAEVTIERALGHLTGLYNFTDDASFLNRVAVPIAPADLVAFALEHPRAFTPPGQSYSYSNTNFVLLAMVIEAVTGEDYASVVRARFLDPLGLENTFIEGGESAPGLVPGYLLTAAPPPYDASWGFGTGSLVSNGDDLCRWADMLYRGTVLPPSLRALLTTESHPADGTNTNYGVATDLRRRGGIDVVGHTGSTMGFNAEVFIDPASGDCIAVLSNDFFGEPDVLSQPLWELVASN
ncbi:MAG: serine hydrolase domain-containing protein [Kofleriaceae bacterium]